MAVTSGFVQKISWASAFVCAQIGPDPGSSELVFVQFKAGDDAILLALKRSLVNLLAWAKTAGYPVSVAHGDASGEIVDATMNGFDISPVGNAIHRDFYSIAGDGIPSNARVVFESDTATVTVTPDFVRPHLVLIADLPSSIPAGHNTVRLQAAGFDTDAVPVWVQGGERKVVRVLYTGAAKDRPYTIAFVANPAIQTEAGAFTADPVLTNRADYHSVVAYCLRNLLTVTEDLLRQSGWDGQIRFVSVFDRTLSAVDGNALAHELPPNLMETRRAGLNGFLLQYREVADIVLVIHGSTTHDRATAWFTTDDGAKPTGALTYDGAARTPGRFPPIPGSAALPLDMDRTGLTPLHETGHAASDFDNGRVIDLYSDGLTAGFVVNRKTRAMPTDPVPANFATYNGTVFASDPGRDGLGYPSPWTRDRKST